MLFLFRKESAWKMTIYFRHKKRAKLKNNNGVCIVTMLDMLPNWYKWTTSYIKLRGFLFWGLLISKINVLSIVVKWKMIGLYAALHLYQLAHTENCYNINRKHLKRTVNLLFLNVLIIVVGFLVDIATGHVDLDPHCENKTFKTEINFWINELPYLNSRDHNCCQK